MLDKSLEFKEVYRKTGITVRATGMSHSNGEGVETGWYERKAKQIGYTRA